MDHDGSRLRKISQSALANAILIASTAELDRIGVTFTEEHLECTLDATSQEWLLSACP